MGTKTKLCSLSQLRQTMFRKFPDYDKKTDDKAEQAFEWLGYVSSEAVLSTVQVILIFSI